ncbi:MAG: hypothetical protein IKK94_01405 [Clostridia bacterium]|nr:hypothetical protein [Clostridia bacterium]
MKKLFALFLLMILLLCSCGKTESEELLHYQKYPFAGEFELLREDTKFTLRICGDALKGNGKSRDLVAEFIAPESMKGVKISRFEGKIIYSLSGIEFEEKEMPVSICDFASYFELSASAKGFSKENGVTFADLITDDGEKIRITFSQDGSPTKFEGEKMTINVLSYKIKK